MNSLRAHSKDNLARDGRSTVKAQPDRRDIAQVFGSMGTHLSGVYDRHGEKLRFLVVGVWNTCFNIATLWILDQVIPYDPDSLIQKELVLFLNWVIAVTQNFFTFKLLVFRTRGNWLAEYLRMYVTYTATFVVQSVMTLTISQVFGLSVFWANLPTIVVVTVMSYIGHRYFTFRKPEES